MTDIPYYGSIAECPKCGASAGFAMDVRYCSGSRSSGEGATPYGCEGFTDEHLHVTCYKCSFDWLEWCKDKDKASVLVSGRRPGCLCTDYSDSPSCPFHGGLTPAGSG